MQKEKRSAKAEFLNCVEGSAKKERKLSQFY